MNDAIISMDWGDGTAFDAQSLDFFHNYASAGSFQTSLVVIDEEAVRYYQMTVSVSAQGTSQHVVIDVPSSIPAGGDNPGFENVVLPQDLHRDTPEHLPTLSEWGLMVMALLALTAGTVVFGRRHRPAAGA